MFRSLSTEIRNLRVSTVVLRVTVIGSVLRRKRRKVRRQWLAICGYRR